MLDPLAKIEDVIRLSQAIPGSQIKAYQNLGQRGRGRVPEDLRPGLRSVLPGYRGQGFVKLQKFFPLSFPPFPWYNKEKN